MKLWYVIFGVIPVLELLCTADSSAVVCRQNSYILDCRDTGISELPSNIDYNVTSLDLSINQFEHIPTSMNNFLNLMYLNLSYNAISSLGHSDFSGMEKLERLDLSFNLFHDWKDIHTQALTPLSSLIFLDFSNNPLRSLAPVSRHFVSNSLTILKLNNCSMTTILVNNFKKLPNLKELHLKNNPVRSINGSFKSDNLKFVDLSWCSLEYMSENLFLDLSVLETLVLNNNKYLREVTINSNSLIYLDLSNCNLEKVPSGNLRAVTTVDLQENFLKIITSNSLLEFSNLLVLNLSLNAISSIEGNAFRGLDSLQTLDLSLNKLTTVDEKILLPTISLRDLNLSHNYISSLDTLTSSSLRTLDVSYCEIYEVNRDSLLNLPKLMRLSLSRNFISSLPDGWTADRLIDLDLSGCRIKSITNRSFEQMSYLRRIDLSSNRLSTIDPGNFPQVLYVNLEDNQWRCECQKLKDMFEWTIESGSNLGGLICDSPEKLAGMTWQDACKNEWYPEMNKGKQLYWYTIIVVVAMVTLLVIVIVLRKLNNMKEERFHELQEQRRAQERDAREALQRQLQVQREFIEEADRNAPNPRESQGPPSYSDALLLPRLDSQPSLTGSLHSIASRHSIHGSNPDINKKSKVRRKRRRRKSEESREVRLSRPIDDGSDSGPERPQPPLESDF